MGRNGVRVGDWVEINGVSGEVIELGVFHTVLLETGNWTDAGQPTGRRVTFTNSYAIERHYFNFSTSGQWLWDELLVLVPYDKDPNLIADAIHREVEAATAASATDAEQEWRRSAAGRRGSSFSAAPSITVAPLWVASRSSCATSPARRTGSSCARDCSNRRCACWEALLERSPVSRSRPRTSAKLEGRCEVIFVHEGRMRRLGVGGASAPAIAEAEQGEPERRHIQRHPRVCDRARTSRPRSAERR